VKIKIERPDAEAARDIFGKYITTDLPLHDEDPGPVRRSGAAPAGPVPGGGYSHSMVPGGLLVTSSVTRLISRTSLVMRLEILASTS
ncbi:hypothetical protein AB0M72_31285, partial [Nocardiopsis dassonvillei]